MALFFSHLVSWGSGDLDLVVDDQHTFEVAHEFLRDLLEVLRGKRATQMQDAAIGLKLAADLASAL